jgi:serine/threonine protein kinase
MAPEIGLTGTSGPASDLYALGITLYELIVGRTPHGGGQALAVLARHIERRPKRAPGIPDALWDVVEVCTAREPGDRPEAAAVAEALAAAEPALVGLPALEAVPRSANFQVTSEPRNAEAESPTVAVPWLAAVAAANRLTQAVDVAASEVHEPTADHDDGADNADAPDEDVFAAALLKPPPSGPFSTLPQHPAPGPRVHLPTVSRTTRRRVTLIGAPLVLLGVVSISLIASGAFAGTPQSPTSEGRYSVGGPGSAHAGGAGGSRSAGATTAAAKTSASKPKSKSPSASATSPVSSASSAPVDTTTTVGGTIATTVTTTTTSISTSSPPTVASPAVTNTGLVCRSGGFKNLGGFSEDPCIQDDNGTLTLKGELKGGSYNTAMVVVVRVDYGGVYSSAHISNSVTPSQLGDHIYVYSVTLGSWPAGEDITCEENVDKASTPTDYTYGSNSADIKTTS